MILPYFLMIKKKAREAFKPFLDYFLGQKVANMCAGAFFPSLNKDATNHIPHDIPLLWLGWDMIRNGDIADFQTSGRGAFMRGYRTISQV